MCASNWLETLGVLTEKGSSTPVVTANCPTVVLELSPLAESGATEAAKTAALSTPGRWMPGASLVTRFWQPTAWAQCAQIRSALCNNPPWR